MTQLKMTQLKVLHFFKYTLLTIYSSYYSNMVHYFTGLVVSLYYNALWSGDGQITIMLLSFPCDVSCEAIKVGWHQVFKGQTAIKLASNLTTGFIKLNVYMKSL